MVNEDLTATDRYGAGVEKAGVRAEEPAPDREAPFYISWAEQVALLKEFGEVAVRFESNRVWLMRTPADKFARASAFVERLRSLPTPEPSHD